MSEPWTPIPEEERRTPDVPPELLGGVHLLLDGGEIDTTIRPTQIANLRRQPPEGESNGPPAAPASGLPVSGARKATVRRETGETKIELTLDLDGTGRTQIATGVGFFDHMLTLLGKHSLIDLEVKAEGDLHVDGHHTVEDVGICFGKALGHALGSKAGIRRYGSATLPMDEVLVTAAIDLSGRPFCVWLADVPRETLGTFNASLAEEFWRAVSSSGLFNLHVLLHHGRNTHHIVEGIFKAAARALRQAVERDPRATGVPSTKGVL
jgi:imidazoleglycerol-phosphate dehydratase